MGIAKFDDGTALNPKLHAAGPTSAWLWFCGILYCRRALTDGFIPKAVVPTLVIGLASPYKHAARLVEVALWHDAVGGYIVHDYLDWNPTKAAMGEFRRRDRERKHLKHGIQETSSNGIRTESERNPIDAANAGGTRAGAKSKSESESESERFLGSEVLEESARETTPRRQFPTRQPVAMSPLYHGNNCPKGWGAAACAGGFCVPKYLWPQWEKRGGSTPEWLNTLRVFVEHTMARTPPGAGDRAEVFWPSHLAAHFGTSAPKSTAGRQSAAQRTIATLREG